MLRRMIAGVGFLVGVCAAGNAGAEFNPLNPFPDPIPKGPIRIELETVASGLVAPNLLTSPDDGTDRQFIVDQIGRIVLIKDGVQQAAPVLDLSSSLVALGANYDERGLLGLAFDPDFATPGTPGFGRFFTYTSEPVSTAGPADFTVTTTGAKNHQSVLASWKMDPVNPDMADPASRQVIMRIDQPQSNHNGSTLAFGPDKNLYMSLGDGGGARDTADGHTPNLGNGQDITNILGSVVRIDVNGNNSANGKYGIPADNPFVGVTGVDEIYAYGFRNPFRFSFDGDRLILADVGQGQIEEVDIVSKGGNYGWNLKEGQFRFITNGTISDDLTGLPAGLIDPVLQYDHSEGIAIVGGFVYRGSAIPELVGKYVFGDYSTAFNLANGHLFYGDLETGEVREFLIGFDPRSLGLYVKGMGMDQDGELYVLASSRGGPSGDQGVALKIVAVPEPAMVLLAVWPVLLLLGRKRARSAVVATCALCIFASVSSAALVQIQPIKDNTLYQSTAGSVSNGAGSSIFVGKTNQGQVRRGLVAFDVASHIPAGSIIDSVTLTLNVSRTIDQDTRTLTLRPALKGWGEGTSTGGGGGGPSAAGDATWIHTFYSGALWTNPGGDFGGVSASHSFGNEGSHTFNSTAQLVADVQTWLEAPNNNYGWFLIGDEGSNATTRQLDSSENGAAANRPLLTINYTVPEPHALLLLPLAWMALHRRLHR